jgi:hypothetical protein
MRFLGVAILTKRSLKCDTKKFADEDPTHGLNPASAKGLKKPRTT